MILERGPWWGPMQRSRSEAERREFPRGIQHLRKLLRNIRVARKGRRFEKVLNVDGLLEFHRFDQLDAITASGVGGGSHIYTSILEEPPAEYFTSYFPPEITSDEMRPYFARVRQMLRPARVPEPPEKTRVFEDAVRKAGLPACEYPELAIVWGSAAGSREKVVNAAGVEQAASTGRGDVLVGCEDGSKTTLDLTYVPLALRSGAELRPLCEVLAVGSDAGGYTVRYLDHRDQGVHRESAPRLILAAGGLNTQRLLFDARQGHGALPNLPAALGKRFSPNADFGALLWRSSVLKDSSRGPSFGAFSRIRRGGIHRFLVGEVGVPAHALPLPAFILDQLRRSAVLLCMGRDASNGTIGFDGTGLTTSVGRSMDAALYEEMEQAVARVRRHYGPRRLISSLRCGGDRKALVTVHPLGGCSIGRSVEDGFTDHQGQVFGHRGLFVADGSLYPRSPGIAPSMTIAALAERQGSLMK